MFLGHFGVGFGAKAVARKTSLGTLFLAAQFVDLLWPTLLLIGVERVQISPGITAVTPLDFVSYPISHSLLAAFVWSGLFGGAYFLLKRYRKGAIVCAVAVVSHWILDFLTHRPDLPLFPGSEVKVGLGLWNSLTGTIIVEMAIFVLGVSFYFHTTQAKDRIGGLALWSLLAFFLIIYFSNIFGEPPANAAILAWVGQAQWLLILWGYWVDRHREDT